MADPHDVAAELEDCYLELRGEAGAPLDLKAVDASQPAREAAARV
jgi:hypothetical protein